MPATIAPNHRRTWDHPGDQVTRQRRLRSRALATALTLGSIACLAGTADAQVDWHPHYGPQPSTAGPSPAGLSPPTSFASDHRDDATEPAAANLSDVIEQQRDRLYRDLAAEFASFDRLGNLVRRVSRLVQPSVIHIEAHKVEGTGPSAEAFDEAGSGVLIRVEGRSWVLTNRHVILGADAEQIQLRSYDGRSWKVGQILLDDNTDVAVMELLPAGRRFAANRFDRRPIASVDLPAARLGDSSSVEIGDFVIAIGSPFGLSHSVTFGIMSAKGRRDLSLGEQRIELQDFFQTDAAINPGNSGGPLLNLRGEVIGINTAIASSSGGSEGIGFAIPIDMAEHVAGDLIRHGRLRRGYLGVTLDPAFTASTLPAESRYASMRLSQDGPTAAPTDWDFPSMPPGGGAKVKDVRPGSPAALARLQKDDVILEFDGVAVQDDDHLVARVGLTPSDQPISMVVLRGGRRYETRVVLTGLP